MTNSAIDPATLRAHYRAFLRGDRVLLTGHSHQAWPDVARDGQIEAWDAAARDVDDKWDEAFAVAGEVRGYVADCLGAQADQIALGQSTHELVTRFLSALPWTERRHLVTTTGEFHSARRQLARLSEAGVEITYVDAASPDTLAERLAAAIRPDTAAVLVSSVLFETSAIVPHLPELARRAHERRVEVLIDAYHAFSVVPFDVSALPHAFVTAGGYKYAQWGEGCCFLRVPAGSTLRPIYTGWFSDFASLAHPQGPAGERIGYGSTGADRFAGSTYDPVSHYRARAVIRFFLREGLTIERLRACSMRQTERIVGHLSGMTIRSPLDATRRGGFVAVQAPGDASRIVKALREKNVLVDARNDVIRFGPAPYVTDEEVDRAMAVFRAVI